MVVTWRPAISARRSSVWVRPHCPAGYALGVLWAFVVLLALLLLQIRNLTASPSWSVAVSTGRVSWYVSAAR